MRLDSPWKSVIQFQSSRLATCKSKYYVPSAQLFGCLHVIVGNTFPQKLESNCLSLRILDQHLKPRKYSKVEHLRCASLPFLGHLGEYGLP